MKKIVCSDETIYAAESAARALYPGFFVYRGGSHVAVSRRPGDANRLIFAPNCRMEIGEVDLAGIRGAAA
jgi:hypothetical protein